MTREEKSIRREARWGWHRTMYYAEQRSERGTRTYARHEQGIAVGEWRRVHDTFYPWEYVDELLVDERHAYSTLRRAIPMLTPYTTVARYTVDRFARVLLDAIHVRPQGYVVRRVWHAFGIRYEVMRIVTRKQLRDARGLTSPLATPLRIFEAVGAQLDADVDAWRKQAYGARYI